MSLMRVLNVDGFNRYIVSIKGVSAMVQWQRLLFHRLCSVPCQQSAGFYIIEFMLSLVLSSIVIAVLLSLTFAGWRTYLTSLSYANTNDSSRAAFVFLDRQLSAAGYRALMWEKADAIYTPIPASLPDYPAFAAGQVISATPSVTGNANRSNVILYIRKQGGFQDDYDASGNLLSPLPWASSLTTDVIVTDCLGERIPSKVVIIERYRIDVDRRLVCSRVFVDSSSPAYYTAAPTQEVLILNYAYEMRAAFGTYSAVSDPQGQVQRYENLQTMTTGSSTAQTRRWINVVNVQLDILIARGDDRNIDNSIGRGAINLFGHNNITSVPANHFATVESRVINLRNRAY